MVKLAEPRQRSRYTLVPRGKALYEDDARFGTKMLEKMGWSKGKGLGANEDGRQDFVRIRYKNDEQGLGFEARDDQWTKHEQCFNGLLQSLNENNDDTAATKGSTNAKSDNVDSDVDMRPVGFGFAQTSTTIKSTKPFSFKAVISGESLEEKSKNSRARVHYKKFTRGKDLSQYSEKDLANIFGKKALEEVTNDDTNHENVEETKSHFQSSKLTVTDYFKTKMEKINKLKEQQRTVEESFVRADSQNVKDEEPTENRKDKKKRKRDAEQMKEINNEIPSETLSKQKKKKKKQKMSEESNGLIQVMETAAVEQEEVKLIEENTLSQTNCENNNEDQNMKRRKKSKKSKKNADCDQKFEKEKDTKLVVQTEKENFEKCEQNSNSVTKPQEKNIKREKKKKKNKHEAIIDNIPKTEATIINITDPTKNHEKKSKKRKTKNAVPIQENGQELNEKFPKELSVTSSQNPKNKEPNNINEERKITVHYKNTPKDGESLTIKEIENALEAQKVYELSSFAAEQFRFTDISGFNGSNLSDIMGYGIEEDVQIEIVENEYDAKRISQLWSCTMDKYQFLTRPYSLFKEYTKKAHEALQNKEKPPRFKIHQYRRKDAFKTVTI